MIKIAPVVLQQSTYKYSATHIFKFTARPTKYR